MSKGGEKKEDSTIKTDCSQFQIKIKALTLTKINQTERYYDVILKLILLSPHHADNMENGEEKHFLMQALYFGAQFL